MRRHATTALLFCLVLELCSVAARADDDGGCGAADAGGHGRAKPLKIVAFLSILVCGAIGCCLPVLGRRVPALSPDRDVFFVIKAFAAGVIVATGFIHILPDAFESLTSECLARGPWHDFPFAGFGAMVGAIGTLVIDTVATGYFTRVHFKKTPARATVDDEEKGRTSALEAALRPPNGAGEHEGHVHMHTHATHGHAHGSAELVSAVGVGDGGQEHVLRHRVISQVLELGILVHSVIVGVSLGASQDPETIKPLVVALSFHQMFEGMGLGGCIAQAKFEIKSIVTMVLFFSLTTPVGILIGIGISSVYNENSPTALVVEGLLNSIAAGILIYMALVDLLAEDFMNPRTQSRGKLQLAINVSMLVGAGLMSMLAKWA